LGAEDEAEEPDVIFCSLEDEGSWSSSAAFRAVGFIRMKKKKKKKKEKKEKEKRRKRKKTKNERKNEKKKRRKSIQ